MKTWVGVVVAVMFFAGQAQAEICRTYGISVVYLDQEKKELVEKAVETKAPAQAPVVINLINQAEKRAEVKAGFDEEDYRRQQESTSYHDSLVRQGFVQHGAYYRKGFEGEQLVKKGRSK